VGASLQCTACTAGTYSLYGTSCVACLSGSYSGEQASTCSACPANSVSGTNAATCACTAGYFGVGSGAGLLCSPCGLNTFSASAGAVGQCTVCPLGSTSGFGATTCQCSAGYATTGFGASLVCNACAAGTYSPTGASCLACTPGSFSNALAGFCTGCPAASTSGSSAATCTCNAGFSTTGSGSSLQCTPCFPGFYSVNGVACVACPAGSTSGFFGASTCTCNGGFAQAGTGASLVCTACTAGTFAITGSPACSACAAGTFSPAQASSCSVCPIGSSSTQGASSCTCNAGYSTAGSGPTLFCSLCAPGTYSQSGDATCTACAPGSFNSQPGQSTCQLCNPGSYGVSSGATSASACLFCPAGTYQTASGATSCTNCTVGTSSSSIGAPLASTCVACAPGTSQALNGQATCNACAANTYSQGGAVTCTPCLAGSSASGGAVVCSCNAGFFSVSGTATTVACTACPVNTYSTSIGSTSCTACPAGYFTANAASTSALTCQPCARGLFSTGNGAACTACPLNTYSNNVGSAACTNCLPGTFTRAVGSNSSALCAPCPAGTVSLGSGDACQSCPANTYANLGVLTGSTACLNCSVNFDTAGAVSSTACTACPAGYSSAGVADACAPCAAGTFSPTSASSCQVCSPNTYSLSGSSGCTLCPAGTDTRGAGRAGSAAACQPCAAGFFSLGTGDSCVACPANTYSASGSTTGATACNVCPAGKDTNGGTAKTDVSDCIDCGPGLFTAGNQVDCAACPAGTYTGVSSGATTCENCAVGTYSSNTGQSSDATCLLCPSGTSTLAPGATALTSCQCNPGTIGTITSIFSQCRACPGTDCDAKALCAGGSTCGGCVFGFVGSGNPGTCVAGTTKLATVSSTATTATCPGFAYQGASCTACANLGAGTALTGVTPATCVSAGQSPCCNLPYFYLGFTGTTVRQYALMEFNVISSQLITAQYCVSNMVINLNAVQSGTFVCSSPATLYHVIETVRAADWDAATVTFATDSVVAPIDTLVFTGTGANGYQSGGGSLRFLTVSQPADLNALNANIQLNNGRLSFRLKRYCSVGTTLYSSPFNGISFPGSRVGNTTYFDLSPSQTTTSQTCDPNASCTGGACVCNAGFVGNGLTCTRCFGSSVCGANIMCMGGSSCGTTCNPGYFYDGTACVAFSRRLVTVIKANPTAPACVGTQLGSYADGNAAVTCNPACQLGPATAASFCGTSAGTPTKCCYRPTFLWSASPNPAALPSLNNLGAYPVFSLPVTSAGSATNMCLTSLSLVSADVGTGCAVSQFQIGFVNDGDWTNTLTWNQAQQLAVQGTVVFSATNLTSYVPSTAALDAFTANLRANNGQLSFFIRRWCNTTSISYSNAGFDDNQFQASNFQLTNVKSIQCDPNASCAGATCVCNTNYFGSGTSCQPATCTGNVATGFFFDATATTLAGQIAVTTTCAPGLIGNATRLCVWNGPRSATGVWAAPVNNCQPVKCVPESAYNATFGAVLIGSSSGECNVGYAGTISATCLLDYSSGSTAYYGAPTGSCNLITCEAGTYDYATWPTFAPFAVDTMVNGTCVPGFRPTDPSRPPQRLCPGAGTYSATVDNACQQIFCPAQTGFNNADWAPVPAGSTATGVCVAGYLAGVPQRACLIDGTWDNTVTSPCQPIVCPLMPNRNGATFNATNAGTTIVGTCLPGYYQDTNPPTLACSIVGTWAGAVVNPCIQLTCPAVTSDPSTTWPSGVAGSPPTFVLGACKPGYYVAAGVPFRGCAIDGTFTDPQNPCLPITCPALTVADSSNATFASSPVGSAIVGTCLPGYNGTATRDCTGVSTQPGTWGPVLSSCSPVYCNGLDGTADPALLAQFPAALAEAWVVGTCAPGWYGRPRLYCGLDGQYDTANLVNPCSNDTLCPALDEDGNAAWDASVGGNAVGTCLDGYVVSVAPFAPQRTCSDTTGWGAITLACTQLQCPAVASGFATFAPTAAGAGTVAGTCIAGYGGAATATCNADGTWTFGVSTCAPLACEAYTDVTVSYSASLPGETVAGVCAPGYGGSPVRVCSDTGILLAPTGVACVRGTCSPIDDGIAAFDQAPSGTLDVPGTCMPGYYATDGNPPTRSCNDDLTWQPVQNQCTRLVCGETTDVATSASFPATLSNTMATGTCLPGFAPGPTPPTRFCQLSGAFAAVTGTCVQLFCASNNTEYNAVWPSNVAAGTLVTGDYCKPGWTGTISRQCQLNGEWAPNAVGGCTQIFCQPTSSGAIDGYASWPVYPTSATAVLVTVTACDETYAGSPSRLCQPNGLWGPVSNPCQVKFCAAIAQEGNAAWPNADAGTTVQGVCIAANGYEGIAVRSCSSAAIWGPITTPCVAVEPPCASIIGYQGRTNWPSTPAGDTATGTCAVGYTTTQFGPPTRACLGLSNGTWAVEVTDDCIPATDGSGVSRITSVSFTDVQANAMTLSWTALESATAFYIAYTSDGVTFLQVPPPPGYSYINTTSATVNGLAEQTTYFFLIYAGDQNGRDTNIFTPAPFNTTLIKPAVFNVLATVSTQTSVRFSWAAGSSLTAYYLVYGQRVTNSRNLFANNQTLIQNGTATTATAAGLAAGSFYLFTVYSMLLDGSVGNQAQFTFQTLAESGSAGLPPGSVALSGGLLGGVLGAIVALIAALIIGFVVSRRIQMRKQKALLADYQQQLQMLTMGRTGGLPLTFFGNLQELDAKQLKMNLTVPKTKMIGEGAAQVADVASVQLPAFLLLDYTTDVRPEARLSSSGSAGAIFRAVLLSAEAIERNGSEVVALKEMVEWPSLSDEDNKARFMQELSMMWALSFHPNIAKVVGYTETPLATLTKLYPTDLFRYLHMQDDKEQLESHLLLHLCSGIVAGLAAVHSLKIAHRDMNSPNVLLGEPKAGNVFPEPVLADFGIARATEDNSRFESVNGYSPRYAAPEVIARIQVKSAGSSLEDDMESDLYALGVVLWETLSRRIPWDGYTNGDIEDNVRGGGRVPELEIDGQDKIVALVNDVVVSLLQPSPQDRPSAAATNRKFARFIRDLMEADDENY
jgi:hypothetical protein